MSGRVWLRMTYRCCGMEWTDEWPEPFPMECPDCTLVIEALEIVEIERPAAPARLKTPSDKVRRRA